MSSAIISISSSFISRIPGIPVDFTSERLLCITTREELLENACSGSLYMEAAGGLIGKELRAGDSRRKLFSKQKARCVHRASSNRCSHSTTGGRNTACAGGMALMDPQQLTSQMKIHGDALGTLAKFANEVAAENAKLQDQLINLKAWVHTVIAGQLDSAVAKLTQQIKSISAEAVNQARARARRAEKEVADLEELLTKPGTMRAIKLLHTAEGKTVGAIITDRLQS